MLVRRDLGKGNPLEVFFSRRLVTSSWSRAHFFHGDHLTLPCSVAAAGSPSKISRSHLKRMVSRSWVNLRTRRKYLSSEKSPEEANPLSPTPPLFGLRICAQLLPALLRFQAKKGLKRLDLVRGLSTGVNHQGRLSLLISSRRSHSHLRPTLSTILGVVQFHPLFYSVY
ncbi:hypothetical protein NL676_034328 [Syzygium grande]|nr:hypothetical protein NL676_034328 [Syzygium grande]